MIKAPSNLSIICIDNFESLFEDIINAAPNN